MNLSIFGLGYVGAVSLACLARDGHDVIGVDVDAAKLELVRAGRTPIIEAGMAELMADVVASGRAQVTADAAFAVHHSDLSFLCVGTPSLPNGGQDLRALERLARELGAALRTKAGDHVLVLRSTVLPGTVEGTIIPLLEKHSGKRCGRDFDVCYQPEFLREGSSIRDYDHPPFIVVGGTSARAVELLREVFGHLPGGFRTCAIRTAEMLKYACNAFHALKITFANEMGRVSQALEIDVHAVMDLVCADTQFNISTAYLRPGMAFGGSCLPKDLRALCHLASRRDVAIPMLAGMERSNEVHIEQAVQAVLASGRRSVGMLGLAFKAGTDDLRESPLVVMAERFIGKGLRLQIYDPQVSMARLVGANRTYIEQTIPHVASLLCDDPDRLVEAAEVVVVGLNGEAVRRALARSTRDDHLVLDLVNLPDRDRLRGRYRGVCW